MSQPLASAPPTAPSVPRGPLAHTPRTPPVATSASAPMLSARRSGAGPRIVCLHSSTGSQAQWRALAERLEDRAQPVAPDLFGHGRSPAWPEAAANTLDTDARAVRALLQADDHGDEGADRGIHLVGHSYGAAVALRLALRMPQRVRSLTLYEPVLFGLLGDVAAEAVDPGLEEIRDIARTVAARVRAGDLAAAAQVFVAYWGGACAWHAMNDAQQATVVHRIPTVPRHFEALFAARWGLRHFSRLQMPVQLMHGSGTRTSARRVADRLAALLPNVRRTEIAGAAHLGPLTHADTVADAMARHLDTALSSPPPRRPHVAPQPALRAAAA